MIFARLIPEFDAFTARLAAQASRLAEARAATAARRNDPRRWRDARLLWPLF